MTLIKDHIAMRILIKNQSDSNSKIPSRETKCFIILSEFFLIFFFLLRPLKFRPSQQNQGEDDATCKYNCKENGGCNVKIETSFPFSGMTSGSCFPPDFGGECSGIPQRCDNCDKKCENKSGEIFSIKANPN